MPKFRIAYYGPIGSCVEYVFEAPNPDAALAMLMVLIPGCDREDYRHWLHVKSPGTPGYKDWCHFDNEVTSEHGGAVKAAWLAKHGTIVHD